MTDFEPVRLVLWTDDIEPETVELSGPGGTIRIAVGEPGRQSGIWRIWSPANKSDVYIGVRAILGHQKWSLHESGDWRHQWVSSETAAVFGNVDSRIIDQWEQPAEMGESGITKGFTIRVRHQDLVDVADVPAAPKDTVWIPAPPEGRLIALHVAIARPTEVELSLTGFIPLGGYTLEDGRAVLLGVSAEPLTDEHNQTIATALETTLRLAQEGGVDISSGALRGALSCTTAEGDRCVWDVAVVPQQAGDGA